MLFLRQTLNFITVIGLFCLSGAPAHSQQFQISQEIRRFGDQVITTSQYYLRGNFVGALRDDSAQGISIIVLENGVQRTLKSARDFSEADRQKYKYEYAQITGTEPADRASKVEWLRKFDPNGLRVLDELSKKLVFDYATIPDGQSIISLVESIFTGVHESVHQLNTNHFYSGNHRSIQLSLVGGEHVVVLLDQSLKLKDLYQSYSPDRLAHPLANHTYEKEYLQSNQGIEALIDELNAYTQGGLNRIRMIQGFESEGKKVEVRTSTSEFGSYSIRYVPGLEPGVPAFMVMIGEFLTLAKQRQSSVWNTMRNQNAAALRQVYYHAQQMLIEVCGAHKISKEDQVVLNEAFSPAYETILQEVIGSDFHFTPPTQCLVP